MKKQDAQLKTDVENELSWDPKLRTSRITVTAEDGAISLHGVVDNYAEQEAADEAVMRVTGVRSIARDVDVKLMPDETRTDAEIAKAVHHQLRWNVFVPRNVTATVEGGIVTLVGHATWNFQRAAARHAVCYLVGVVGVVNSIALRPDVSPDQIKERIDAALRRQATTDGESIDVKASGHTVTLSGQASSWGALRDAKNAAWAAPGVTDVVDNLTVA